MIPHMNVTLQREVPLQLIADMLAFAFEGGSCFWCEVNGCKEPSTWTWRDKNCREDHSLQEYPLNPDGKIFLIDTRDGEEITLDWQDIEEGLQIMAMEYLPQFDAMWRERGDARTGDTLLQCCCFGSVLYQ